MWPNPQFPVDLVTFTEYILNGKLHLFCSENFYKHLFYRTLPDDYQKQPFVDVLQTRCSCPEVFCKKGGCRNFAKFIGKQLYQSLLFNKLQAWQACNFIKTEIWHRCFPVYFAKFLRTTFLQNTSGRLLPCFTAFSDWEFLPQRFKFAIGKYTLVSIIVYWNILSDFEEPQVEQPKQLLHLKKPLTIKFLRLSLQFGFLELISHNPMLF